jgi:hypothetical protein
MELRLPIGRVNDEPVYGLPFVHIRGCHDFLPATQCVPLAMTTTRESLYLGCNA